MNGYLNRNENAFVKILKSRKYIDKTGLLSILNKNLGTADNCICVSRPRRFGKSFNAAMINAYYSKCVNAVKLFAGLKIAESTDYLNELNRHNVIVLFSQSVDLTPEVE